MGGPYSPTRTKYGEKPSRLSGVFVMFKLLFGFLANYDLYIFSISAFIVVWSGFEGVCT